MDIKWNYKIDLVDECVFSEIEKERGISIPDSLVELVKEGNAATPERYKYVIGSTEKMVGAILSFNRNEEDTDTVFTALSVIDDKDLMPFAIDSFGNYVCLDLVNEDVVFWDHEIGEAFSTEKKLAEFLEQLY